MEARLKSDILGTGRDMVRGTSVAIASDLLDFIRAIVAGALDGPGASRFALGCAAGCGAR